MRNSFMAKTGEVCFGSAFVPHEKSVLYFDGKDGMTRQEFAEEADINTIMARYEKTGLLPHYPDRKPFYGDFVDLPSFQEAQEIILQADAAFMALPARVRAEFDNDPARFVEFAQDPSNIGRLREWGLAEPLDQPEAVQAASAAVAPQAASEPSGDAS